MVLHSGAILLLLLAPYFLVLFVLLRMGAQLVRSKRLCAGRGIFGAIIYGRLLSGVISGLVKGLHQLPSLFFPRRRQSLLTIGCRDV